MSKKATFSFSQVNNGYIVKEHTEDLGTFFRDAESFMDEVLVESSPFVRMLIKAMSEESTITLSLGGEARVLTKLKNKKKIKSSKKEKRSFLHPESEIAKRIAERDSKLIKLDQEDSEENLDETLKGEELDELNQARKEIVIPADKFKPTIKQHKDPTIDFENNRITVTKDNCLTTKQLKKMDLPKIFRSSGKSWIEWTAITGANKYFFTNLIVSEEKNGKPTFYHSRTRVILTIGIKYLELLRAKDLQDKDVVVESEVPEK